MSSLDSVAINKNGDGETGCSRSHLSYVCTIHKCINNLPVLLFCTKWFTALEISIGFSELTQFCFVLLISLNHGTEVYTGLRTENWVKFTTRKLGQVSGKRGQFFPDRKMRSSFRTDTGPAGSAIDVIEGE